MQRVSANTCVCAHAWLSAQDRMFLVACEYSNSGSNDCCIPHPIIITTVAIILIFRLWEREGHSWANNEVMGLFQWSCAHSGKQQLEKGVGAELREHAVIRRNIQEQWLRQRENEWEKKERGGMKMGLQEQLALDKKRDDKRYREWVSMLQRTGSGGKGRLWKKGHGGLYQRTAEDNENQTNMIHRAWMKFTLMQLTEEGDKNLKWDKLSLCCDDWDRVWWQALVLPSNMQGKWWESERLMKQLAPVFAQSFQWQLPGCFVTLPG